MIDTLKKAIDPHYHLRRVRRQWLVEESQKILRLRSPHSRSFGFSLDNDSRRALAFFSPNPPRGLAKVCDGMIAVLCRKKKKLYLFAVEVKSAHEDDSHKQLVNGQLFWRWLMDLCRQHGYLGTSIGVFYIGLLMWSPRDRTPRKGTTAHSGQNTWKGLDIGGFDASFEVQNHEEVALIDFIRSAD